ncbi:hypothetical protein [Pseudomonas sp. 10S4]|uniref:hypothetical protein n=1 Tax=Pseudomonas sp. 10S4 TaxID=3048583 RepID=UPI002AC8D02D|nr:MULTISPECIES: hypothetical protein [unclassified Pseudomonas]MEB0222995.1 hypothetical protein [Pseudomonas sp. 5S1]MEB0293599.1 hypothetical protein [Pseudomonas sp. 10S4]WPX17295.1 hypothetical protein RHM58_25790 [Pseudomonas sp. 10S4]
MGTPVSASHPPTELNMIVFDLNTNDSEALIRHVEEFRPAWGDAREDSRLRDALLELREALVSHLKDSAC